MKRRRARILVEIRKLVEGRIRLQHVLVFAFDRKRVVGWSLRSCSSTYVFTEGSLSASFSMSGRKSALTSTVEGASFIAKSNASGGSERLTVCSTTPIIGTAK